MLVRSMDARNLVEPERLERVFKSGVFIVPVERDGSRRAGMDFGHVEVASLAVVHEVNRSDAGSNLENVHLCFLCVECSLFVMHVLYRPPIGCQ